jgi:hypothetical protein
MVPPAVKGTGLIVELAFIWVAPEPLVSSTSTGLSRVQGSSDMSAIQNPATKCYVAP